MAKALFMIGEPVQLLRWRKAGFLQEPTARVVHHYFRWEDLGNPEADPIAYGIALNGFQSEHTRVAPAEIVAPGASWRETGAP